jgi:hypothetical protein
MHEAQRTRGGGEKINDGSDVHLPQPKKKLKKVVTYFVLFLLIVFIAFLGVS